MLGWQDRAHLAEPMVEKERFRYLREIHLLVPNAWFYCRGEKNKPNHRNSSSTENLHGGKRFPHQTSFIGYKYLIIRTRPWNARHFAAFTTCVGVFINDIYTHIHKHIYSYILTNLI